jgi:hypothetical protein
MVCVIGGFCIRSDNQRIEQETTREAATTTYGTTTTNEPCRELSLPEKIINSTKEGRFQYYNSLFENNGNQIKLPSNQTIGNNENSNDMKEGRKSETNIIESSTSTACPDEEDGPSIYLPLDIVWDHTIQRSSVIGNNKKKKRSSSVIILSDTHIISGKTNKTVGGNCVICFEHFEAGDTIVYSKETKYCHHTYHKNCMVG